MDGLGRVLIVFGILIVLIGIAFVVGPKIPFLGRLPGDFAFRGERVSIFFPLVTSIVISIAVTVLLNVIFRIFR